MVSANATLDEDLGEQVERLTDEVKVLRESVDELKTALEWAIRNARITIAFDEAAKAADYSPPPIEMFELGDAVTFTLDGEVLFGEIVGLDDGENRAEIQLIPSNELVPVNQDHLDRVKDDPLSYRSEVPRPCRPPDALQQSPTPPSGRLF